MAESFRMYAVLRHGTHGDYYWGFGNKFYANCFKFGEDKLKEVEVTIDPEGSYCGWLDSSNKLTHLYPNEELTEMCFPYGTKIEEELGRGKKVNCTVREVVRGDGE